MKVPFYKPFLPEWDKVAKDFKDAYSRGWLAPSFYSKRLEKVLLDYLPVDHCILVSNCSDGLTCAVAYSKHRTGRNKAIVPDFTFAATWQAVDWNGLEAILVDVDEEGVIDIASVRRALEKYGPDVSCILPVHMFGNPAPSQELDKLSREFDVDVIYDSAHGFGTLTNGSPLGDNGLCEVFSIGTTKPLSAGEGGVITTNDSHFADSMRRAVVHGHQTGELDVELKSLNGRIQEINSIIAFYALEMLGDNIKMRSAAAKYYNSMFPKTAESSSHSFTLEPIISSAKNVLPSYKDYTVILRAWDKNKGERCSPADHYDFRKHVISFLEANGVPTKTYYYPSLSNLKVVRDKECSVIDSTTGTGDMIACSCISIPFFTEISSTQQDFVSFRLEDALNSICD